MRVLCSQTTRNQVRVWFRFYALAKVNVSGLPPSSPWPIAGKHVPGRKIAKHTIPTKELLLLILVVLFYPPYTSPSRTLSDGNSNNKSNDRAKKKSDSISWMLLPTSSRARLLEHVRWRHHIFKSGLGCLRRGSDVSAYDIQTDNMLCFIAVCSGFRRMTATHKDLKPWGAWDRSENLGTWRW